MTGPVTKPVTGPGESPHNQTCDQTCDRWLWEGESPMVGLYKERTLGFTVSCS